MESAEQYVRAPRGSIAYWKRWAAIRQEQIEQNWERLDLPSANPAYRPQYIRAQARDHLELMLCLYSQGAPTSCLSRWFDGLIRAWEASQALEPEVYPPEVVHSRRHWRGNLDLYLESFWLVGLALTLELPEPLWLRLLALIGNEGEDAVLDAVIACRQPGRRIGKAVLFAKPYARLHAAIQAPVAERPALLWQFVEHWYAELDRPATHGRPAFVNRPYWYTLGDQNFEGGAYFGRWCIEAVAAAKALSIDDTDCCGLEHYPGDLLRPNGPSTHRRPAARPTSHSWWTRLLAGIRRN